MEEQLRDEFMIYQCERDKLWAWETKDFCCEEFGFQTKEECLADFEQFLKDEGWDE